MDIVAKALEHQVLQSARLVEEQLDAELERLERPDEDELERLKERRMEALKRAQKQKQVMQIVEPGLEIFFSYMDNVNIAMKKMMKKQQYCE